MTISTGDELLEQQKKWEILIDKTDHASKKIIEMMLLLRKELSVLYHLKKKFPESVKVVERTHQCDQLLEQSASILDAIKQELCQFKEKKNALDQCIKQYNESTSSGSTGLNC
jgi:hypothetical protein